MPPSNRILLTFLSSLLLFSTPAFSTESAGFCWGRVDRQPLPPSVVVKQLQDNNVTRVKLFNVDPEVLSALESSGLEVMIMVTNNEIENISSSLTVAQEWIDSNVQTWLPAGVNIKYISVGNEPFLHTEKSSDKYLLGAVHNIYQALVKDSLEDRVKVTVSFNAEILSNTVPPSNSTFNANWSTEITNISQLIYNTSSIFSINIYPFYDEATSTPVPYPSTYFYNPSNTSSQTHFAATFDALLYALEAAGIPSDIDVVVGEIGWPTDGSNGRANISTAQLFNQRLLQEMYSGVGTVKRPNSVIRAYLFSLFDEDAKSIAAGAFERRWGFYDSHGSPKYTLDLTGTANSSATLAATPGVYVQSKSYCVAKSGSDTTNLTLVFSYLCTGGNNSDYGDRADCTPVTANFSTDGDVCSSLTLQQRTSYALNQYYQIHGQNASFCDWDGLAQVTSVDPSVSACTFQIGLDISKIEQFTTSSGSFSPYILLYIVSFIALLTAFL